jgi:hypothetical protein
MKICIKCYIEKNIEDFPKKRNECKLCKSLYLKEYRKKNAAIIKEKDRTDYLANREKILAEISERYHSDEDYRNKIKIKSQKNYQKNPEKSAEQGKKYRLAHVAELIEYRKQYYLDNKQELLKDMKVYEKENPEVRHRIQSLYRHQQRQATPKWLSEVQKDEIWAFYRNRPEGYHVDHIIPLQGEIVSGLHVPWNLQHLPASDNIKKSNKIL